MCCNTTGHLFCFKYKADDWFNIVCLSFFLMYFPLLPRICLHWTWSLTDTVVWTWQASGYSTQRAAKWPPLSRNGPWSDCRLHPNLTLVYWTASWPWVLRTKWMRGESMNDSVVCQQSVFMASICSVYLRLIPMGLSSLLLRTYSNTFNLLQWSPCLSSDVLFT